MHYKNGRPANNGDKVLMLPVYGNVAVVGILYDAVVGNNDCNGKIAPCSPSDPMPDLKNCLHIDDVVSATKHMPPHSSVPPH